MVLGQRDSKTITSVGSMSVGEQSLSKDTIFDILSNSRRRYVLYYLDQEPESIQLTDLAEHVAAWENGTDVDSLGKKESKRVYVSLYQTHIPKLAEAGLIEYDKEAGTVSLASNATEIYDYLRRPEDGIPWEVIYPIEAILGGSLLVLTAFNVGAFGLIPELYLSFGIVLVFGITAISEFVFERRRQKAPPELRTK